MFLSFGIVDYKSRGPLDLKLLHQFCRFIPETLALQRNEILHDEFLHFLVRIRTRIHFGTTESTVEPKIMINWFAGLLRLLKSRLKIPLPIDFDHLFVLLSFMT